MPLLFKDTNNCNNTHLFKIIDTMKHYHAVFMIQKQYFKYRLGLVVQLQKSTVQTPSSTVYIIGGYIEH